MRARGCLADELRIADERRRRARDPAAVARANPVHVLDRAIDAAAFDGEGEPGARGLLACRSRHGSLVDPGPFLARRALSLDEELDDASVVGLIRCVPRHSRRFVEMA